MITWLELPLPPPLNATYGTNSYGKFYKKNKAKDWQEEVGKLFMLQRPKKPLLGPLECHIDMFLKRDRDIDSSLKLILDTLADMRFYENDSQIITLKVCKYTDKENPRLLVEIEKLKSLQE